MNFNKHIAGLCKRDLIEEIKTLHRKFKPVREYYAIHLHPQNSKDILERYKKILSEQFYPTRYGLPKLQYSVARKAVRDFKAVSNNPMLTIDLQLTYVEYGILCTLEYGDMDERFYDSMSSMLRKTLREIEKLEALPIFQKRCKGILKKTKDIGWGFGDEVSDLYFDYYDDLEEIKMSSRP